MPIRITSGQECTFAFGDTEIWADGLTHRILCNNAQMALIELTTNETASIPVTNRTSSPVSIHWHGMDVPASMDGHPKHAFPSGSTLNYTFPVRNRSGLYFFHSHSHMATAREVYMGMVGALIVRDEHERSLGLPSGDFEIPMLIQDVRVGATNQLAYSPTMNDMMNGWMGNRVLVNSTPNAFHHVRRATYRLRIVNGSNARVYDLALSNGQEFTIIGTDGGLLESPIPVRNVRLAPGERLDLLVDFSTSSAGDNVKLVSAPYTAPVEMMSPVYPQGLAMDILTFTVTNETGPVFTPPSKLSEFPALPSLNGLRTRIFSLSMARGMGMGMRPQINGLTYNMERIDFTVVRGEFEIFEFRNTENAMFHPMHVHGRQFRVLSRSGGTLLPTDTGYKDTILVAPNETVRVLVQHSEYTGDFLLHCHNLEHEDEGMMMNYYISEVSSVDDTVESAIDIYPNPASTTVTIRSQAGGYKDLAIYDVSGRTVVTRTDVSNGEQVDIRHLTDGHYTLEYGSIQAALVVQH